MLIYLVDGDVVEKKKGTHEEKKQQQPFKSPYSSRTYVVCSLGIGNKVDLMQKRTITCSGSICLYFPLPLARSLVLSAESLNINILTYTRARSKIMKLKCKPSNCVWTLKYEVCECVLCAVEVEKHERQSTFANIYDIRIHVSHVDTCALRTQLFS